MMKQSFAFCAITLAMSAAFASVSVSSCPMLGGEYTNCETIWPDGTSHQTMQDLRIVQAEQSGVTTYQISNLTGNANEDVIVADGVIRPFLIDGAAAIGVWIRRKYECVDGMLKQTQYFPYSNNPNLIQTTMESFYSVAISGDLQIRAQNVWGGMNVITCKSQVEIAK